MPEPLVKSSTKRSFRADFTLKTDCVRAKVVLECSSSLLGPDLAIFYVSGTPWASHGIEPSSSIRS